MTLPVPESARSMYERLRSLHHPNYPPTHPFAGTNRDRASRGDPGHCEPCAALGHVVAHPDHGCGDVGCDAAHGPGHPADDHPPHQEG